jgi:hypothetical protein
MQPRGRHRAGAREISRLRCKISSRESLGRIRSHVGCQKMLYFRSTCRTQCPAHACYSKFQSSRPSEGGTEQAFSCCHYEVRSQSICSLEFAHRYMARAEKHKPYLLTIEKLQNVDGMILKTSIMVIRWHSLREEFQGFKSFFTSDVSIIKLCTRTSIRGGGDFIPSYVLMFSVPRHLIHVALSFRDPQILNGIHTPGYHTFRYIDLSWITPTPDPP